MCVDMVVCICEYSAWYQNDGVGEFGTMNEISTSIDGAAAVIAANFSSDSNYPDVLVTAFEGSQILHVCACVCVCRIYRVVLYTS